MLRILVAVFFWLCAAGVLCLSIRAEITDSHRHPKAPEQAMHRTHGGDIRR